MARKKVDPNIHIGERFERLKIIAFDHQDSRYKFYYLCRCDCGTEKVIRYSHLKNGKIVSCGKCYKPQEKLVKSLIGIPCGRLMPVERLEGNKYRCKCECGNEVVVSAGNLRTKNTQSCGCLQKEIASKVSKKTNKGKYKDLSKDKFERLKPLKIDHVENGIPYWLCKCDCGSEVVVRRDYLTDGVTKSCGCLRRDTSHARGEDLTGQSWNMLTAVEYAGRINGRTMWKFRCDCGNERIYDPNKVKNGCICSCGCNSIAHNGSRTENEIKDFVMCMNNFVEQHNRSILDGREIDILIKDKNIGIEYCGSAYHATSGGLYDNKDKNYHRDKFLEAKENGIHLITIFDVDWENNQEKIKMYLRSLLTEQKKLFARKCNIATIDIDVACDFVDKYHIQGANKATMKINYGLFYKGELLAVMSFGKLRMSKTAEGHFELHRYCVKDGYMIVGGANKLLKTFEKEYSPKYILSYSMNDYFVGGIYERLGFTNSGQCTPRYYWYLGGEELKRESCRLKYLKRDFPKLLQEAYDNGASNKEDYVMLKLGACKVYRSGNTKWEKFYDNI